MVFKMIETFPTKKKIKDFLIKILQLYKAKRPALPGVSSIYSFLNILFWEPLGSTFHRPLIEDKMNTIHVYAENLLQIHHHIVPLLYGQIQYHFS